MKCPNDDTVLTMSERSGIEIDYCPECRGVWLDRGELDKILERATADVPAAPQPGYQPSPQPSTQPSYQPAYQESYRGDPRGGSSQGQRRPKRKEHWLSELFD